MEIKEINVIVKSKFINNLNDIKIKEKLHEQKHLNEVIVMIF